MTEREWDKRLRIRTIGREDESDPIFYINDLLPHLAADYNAKPLGSAIAGEKLNALIGSVKDDKSIKHNVLRLLNEKYGIIEEDFLSAELSLVPAAKARQYGSAAVSALTHTTVSAANIGSTTPDNAP